MTEDTNMDAVEDELSSLNAKRTGPENPEDNNKKQKLLDESMESDSHNYPSIRSICEVCNNPISFSCSCEFPQSFPMNNSLNPNEPKISHDPTDSTIGQKILLPSNNIDESDPELEKLMARMKLGSFKFSKNVDKIKKQLISNFDLFLEGHKSYITTLAVTSDNKFIISGSKDKTIRV